MKGAFFFCLFTVELKALWAFQARPVHVFHVSILMGMWMNEVSRL